MALGSLMSSDGSPFQFDTKVSSSGPFCKEALLRRKASLSYSRRPFVGLFEIMLHFLDCDIAVEKQAAIAHRYVEMGGGVVWAT